MGEKGLSVFSFFSGSGFLDLGFEKSGFNIALVNEFDSKFMEAYKYSRKRMGIEPPEFGYFNTDVNEFLTSRKEELEGYIYESRSGGRLVGFIGGPPCPDFSVAGKNRGKDGDHGKLSQSYADLICMHRPDFFLFENVKGMWRTKMHREFFEALKSQIRESGYDTTERLVNALEYGAPQDRERILMFGVQKDLLDSKTLDDTFPWEKFKVADAEEIKSLPWPDTDKFSPNSETECPPGLPVEYTVEHWFRQNDVRNHPNASHCFTPRAGLHRMETIAEGDVSKKCYKRLHRWRYSPTVAYGNNEVHLHPYEARRISAAEAMSLQSLPKEFCLPPEMPLSAMFKTIGNGVPFLLSAGIASTIKFYLETLETQSAKGARHGEDEI